MAVQKNVSADFLQLLLKAQGDPNRARDDGYTPLLFAAHHQETSLQLVLLLLRYGADPYEDGPGAPARNAIVIAREQQQNNLRLLNVLRGSSIILSMCSALLPRFGSNSLLCTLPIEIFRSTKTFLYD